MFGLAGAWSLMWFGHAALAQTMLVTLAGPFGILTTFRLLRRHSVSVWPPVAGAIAYAANPVLRNGIAQHQVSVVVAYATIPLIATLTFDLVLRREHLATRVVVLRRLAQLLLVLLIAISFAPILLALPLAVALASFAASVMVGTELNKVRTALLRVVGISSAAFLALMPWSLNLLSGGGTTIGFAPRPALSLLKIMSFQTGPNGAGALAIVVWASALLPLFVAAPDALRFAVAGWLLALLGVGGVVVTQHLDATVQLPELGVLLSVSALGLALAVGIGVAAVVSELRTFLFGFRQIVVVVGVASILVPTVAWLGDVPDGRVRAATEDWATELGWMDAEANVVGAFRVLWIGAPAAFPADRVSGGSVDFALTNGAGGDIGELLAPSTPGIALVGESVQLARLATTTRLGHLLAPMNIRYVAVVERNTPDSPTIVDPTGSIGALNGQLDFSVLTANDGIHLYRNLAWAPKVAILGNENLVPIGKDAARDPIDAALRSELGAATTLKNPVAKGTVLLGETDSSRWRATLDGRMLDRSQSFGWATAWRIPQSGTLRLQYSQPSWRWLVVGFEILVFVALLLLSAGATIPRRARGAAAPPSEPEPELAGS